MLSTKDLVFKEQLVKKLVNQYVGLYIINEIVSTNIIKLQLLTSMGIYLIVNINQVVQYRNKWEIKDRWSWKVEGRKNSI